jgi:uncharacterized protein (DUF2237 family)
MTPIEIEQPINIFGETLEPCSNAPMTGFFRDGCCNTCAEDVGSHTVCIEASEEFLNFSTSIGNNLSTPRPEFGFPGVKKGDRWCLCASRWLEAYENGMAPRVVLGNTHVKATEIVPLPLLRKFALDLN